MTLQFEMKVMSGKAWVNGCHIIGIALGWEESSVQQGCKLRFVADTRERTEELLFAAPRDSAPRLALVSSLRSAPTLEAHGTSIASSTVSPMLMACLCFFIGRFQLAPLLAQHDHIKQETKQLYYETTYISLNI